MVSHLAVADLVVTFVVIPMEIGWWATTQWLAGNIACKVFLFVRAFGLYLSSMVTVCLSLDRYFAVMHPIRVSNARHRAKVMLYIGWAVAFVCAFPQIIIFHVSRHPKYNNFIQCVSFGSFSSEAGEMVYNLFGVFVMYFFPLGVIIYSYSRILIKLCNRPTKFSDAFTGTCLERRYIGSERSEPGGACRRGAGVGGGPGLVTSTPKAFTTDPRFYLGRNDVSNIERARVKALRMTVNIMVVFICCWTPYVVTTLWYTFHLESAQMGNSRVQRMLFITAVSNSCMNPLVYANYVWNVRQQCSHLASKICCKGKILRPCRCYCCSYVCGEPEAVPEAIIMDVVPATTRPPRKKFKSHQQSNHQPEQNQESESSLSRILTTKFPGDIQENGFNLRSSHRQASSSRGYYRQDHRFNCPLTPEHSSAPAEMPSERERRLSVFWEEPSSVGWWEISALSDPVSPTVAASANDIERRRPRFKGRMNYFYRAKRDRKIEP